MRLHSITAFACCTALLSPPGVAQETRLAPPQDRITDAVVQADLDGYAAIQQRIKALNDGGRRIADYHLAKAQCWLDASFHEYTRNDRSAYPQQALSESEKLVVAMERGRSPLPMDTPLVNGASRLRDDLWQQLDALKHASGARCAEQKVACAEVELVHAGNEYDQQGWRHAKPYIQIAEDLVVDARTAAQRCDAQPVAVVPAASPQREETLVVQVQFRFDRAAIEDVLPSGRRQLDALIERVGRDPGAVRAIELTGHADRLNGTGDARHNQRLSERRAATIRDLFVAHAVSSTLITTKADGASNPVAACPGPFGSKDRLEDCLGPNRRVDITVHLVR